MASRRLLPKLFVVFVLGVIAAVAFTFLKDMDGPVVEVKPENRRVGAETRIEVAVTDPSGIRELNVGVRKNNNFTSFFRRHYDGNQTRVQETLTIKDARLTEGLFELEVRATDASLAGFGAGNTRTELIEMRYDPNPPRISVKSRPANVWRGGAGAVRFTIDEEVSRAGVDIAGYFVPAALQADGTWVCIYPFPFNMSAPDFKNAIALTATDLAGNVTRTRFTVLAYERKFRDDKLTLTDSFLDEAMAKLHHLAPQTTTPLQFYLTINSVVRGQNVERIRELGLSSAKGKLWDGNFVTMPKAARRSGYGDHRTLYYNGQPVAEATHLALDLASTRAAEVPAANNGVVLYAGELGIYGNLVVVDHGLGVMTLYSHLSRMAVHEGQVVKKGETLGNSGTTGLAFGDHLHFGVVVGGFEVTPVEWIDSKWLENLTRRITQDE